MENYCDIVPHATGWIYVVDGIQSASSYHTSELAMEAAHAYLARSKRQNRKVFRELEVSGRMVPMTASRPGGAPAALPR